jgi:hypothetical protein
MLALERLELDLSRKAHGHLLERRLVDPRQVIRR